MNASLTKKVHHGYLGISRDAQRPLVTLKAENAMGHCLAITKVSLTLDQAEEVIQAIGAQIKSIRERQCNG